MRAAGERQPLLGHMARPADDLEAARFARQSSSRFTERQAVSGTRRLLGRGDIVGQSSGAWHVRHKWGKSSAWICCTWMDKAGTIWDRARRELYRTDPFHSFVSAHRRRLAPLFSRALRRCCLRPRVRRWAWPMPSLWCAAERGCGLSCR